MPRRWWNPLRRLTESLVSVHEQLAIIHTLERAVLAQGARIMSAADDMRAKLVVLGSALDNIAADVTGLKAGIGTGMSDADVADLSAKIDTIAAAAQALADSTPDAPAA